MDKRDPNTNRAYHQLHQNELRLNYILTRKTQLQHRIASIKNSIQTSVLRITHTEELIEKLKQALGRRGD